MYLPVLWDPNCLQASEWQVLACFKLGSGWKLSKAAIFWCNSRQNGGVLPNCSYAFLAAEIPFETAKRSRYNTFNGLATCGQWDPFVPSLKISSA